MKKKEPSVCEEEIFSELYRKHYETATRYIYYKCGDLKYAQDIVQNVFIKIWKLCNSIIYSKAKFYIYTACNNAFLSEVSKKKTALKHLKPIIENINHETPDFLIEIEEFRVKLTQAISDLNIKQREVFLLNRVEDKTYKEIAEITGLTVKAIERRMSLALKELHEKLGKYIKL